MAAVMTWDEAVRISVEVRVASGVALLDAKVPGWRDLIDITAFRFYSTTRCILGQLGKGSFRAGLALVGLDGKGQHGYFHGFDVNEEDGHPEWKSLNSEWLRILRSPPSVKS